MVILEEKVIVVSKRKSVLLLLGAMAFVAAGIWMLSLDAETIESSNRIRSPTVVYGFAVLTSVIFGLCGILVANTLLRGDRGLILRLDRFTDNTGALSAGFVPWSEVVEIRQLKVYKQKLIAVQVRDPEAFLARGNVLQRTIRRINLNWYDAPIFNSSTNLKTSQEVLYSDFEKYFSNYRGSA